MSSHDSFSVSGSSQTRIRKTAIPKANFRIEFYTTICLIVPLCDSAREWLDEHIGKENGYQPYWPTAIVEPRYLSEIITGIRRDGLVTRCRTNNPPSPFACRILSTLTGSSIEVIVEMDGDIRDTVQLVEMLERPLKDSK
jgi:hypothetical protein